MSTEIQKSKIIRVLRKNPSLKNYLSAEQQNLLAKNNRRMRFSLFLGVFSTIGAYFYDSKTNAINKFVRSSRLAKNLVIFGAVPFVALNFGVLMNLGSRKQISDSVRESLNANPEFKEAFEKSR